MTTYSFSPSRLAFYANGLRKTHYEPLNAWPDDAEAITDDVAQVYMTTRIPSGKMLGTENRMPAWVDIPPPTSEELFAAATAKKQELLTVASHYIAPLKDALDGGYIDDVDKPKLTAWQKYRYDLTKVDAAKPVWPEKPAA